MATEAKTKKYIEAVGRRKTAIARVRLTPASRVSFIVNEKEIALYFPTRELQTIATDALTKALIEAKFKVSAKVSGGGSHAQAEAIRHGVARALTVFDAELRKRLKKHGFLKRDPREKERRKFGLRKARKKKQWSKR